MYYFLRFYCFCPFLHYSCTLKKILLVNDGMVHHTSVSWPYVFFLTGAIPKGLILRKFCLMFVGFFLCGFVSGLILWFLDNLWFDVLRAE